MIKPVLLLFIFSILILSILSELRQVFKFQIHGVATPSEHTFPIPTSKETEQKTGDILSVSHQTYDILSSVGYRAQYISGLEDKNSRYSNLISSSYGAAEVMAISMDESVNRLSTQAYFAGLFVSTRQVSTANLALPITQSSNAKVDFSKFSDFESFVPLHEYSKLDLAVLNEDSKECRNINNLMTANKENARLNVMKLYKQWGYFIHQNIFNINLTAEDNEIIRKISSTYMSDYLIQSKLPSFYDNISLLGLFNAFLIYRKDDISNRTFVNPDVVKLAYSAWYNKIISMMKERKSNDIADKRHSTSSPKMVYFSITDFEFIGMQVFINKLLNNEYSLGQPSSSINFEFVRGDSAETSREYFINIVIDGNVKKSIIFQEFIDYVKDREISNSEVAELCKHNIANYNKENLKKRNFAMSVCITIFVVLAVIMLVFVVFLKSKAKKQVGYRHIYSVEE